MPRADGRENDGTYKQRLRKKALSDPLGPMIRRAIIEAAMRNNRLVSARDVSGMFQDERGRIFEVDNYSYSAQFFILCERKVLRVAKDANGNSRTVFSPAVKTGNANHKIWLYQLIVVPDYVRDLIAREGMLKTMETVQ